MRKADDLTPLPAWKQRQRALVVWWKRSRDSRRTALHNLRKTGRQGLTLAISVVGGTLISYGVWSVHHSAGYVVGGLLLWGIQWNYGKEEDSG